MMASLAGRCIRLPSILRRHYQFRYLSSLPVLLPYPCATRVSCRLAALAATRGLSKRPAVAASLGGARNSSNLSAALDIIKKVEEGYKLTHIKMLPNKPTHTYQPRREYVKRLNAIIKNLRPNRSGDVVVAAYVKGEPASGKTQVAREFGEEYFGERQLLVDQTMTQPLKKITGLVPKRVTVATLYARSESAFSRSFFRLAKALHCPLHGLQSAGTLEERLTVYSDEVQQKLTESAHHDWLLIIDEMTAKMQKKFRSYLPQPGSNDWGRGAIVVTTNEDQIIPHSGHFSESMEVKKLSEGDAMTLLKCVSERSEEGKFLNMIVNSDSVKRYPLDIVCAGICIKAKKCTFESYLRQLPHIHTEASRSYASSAEYNDTPISATAKATKQLAESDACLKKVFTVFAAAPHEPIPLSVIRRLMEDKPSSGSQEIDPIKHCGLISRNPEWEEDEPQDSHDTIATLHVHNRTREGLRDEFLENDETNHIIDQFARSLIQECEEASQDTPPASNTWTRQLLFPHLMEFFKEGKRFAIDRSLRVLLGVAVSNAYIDLNQNPERAKNFLTELLGSLADEENTSVNDLTPSERAKINTGFGKAYRHLGQYEKSIKKLTQALSEKECLKPTEVVDIIKEFCLTVPSFGEYQESRELIDLLKSVLTVFKDAPQKCYSVQVEVLISLAYLCLKMGEWKEGKKYLKDAEALKATLSDATFDPTVCENLAIAYSEVGQYKESITFLEEFRKLTDSNHPAMAVPLARLSAAHYYNGDRLESANCAKRALALQQSELDIHIPWNALQILGTTACDFGDVARANEYELIGKLTDYNRDSEVHVPAEATKLLRGRVYRLLGDRKQAQWTLEAALKESEKAYGSNHIRVGKTLTYLGKVYQDEWYLIQALEAFERSYTIHKEFYGDQEHPEVAFIQANRAMILQRVGDQDRGLAMMEEAKEICEKNLDDPAIRPACMHIKYAQMLANYGIILRDMKDPRKLEEAMEPLEKALEIQKRILSEKSLKTIRSEYALGTVHHGLANYELEDESHKQEYYEKAQSQMEKALTLIDSIGVKHPYRATISTGLARLMLDREDDSQAQKHAKEALNVMKSQYEIHPHVGYCYQILGDTSRNPIVAQRSYLRSLEVYVYLIDRETSQMLSGHKVHLGNVTFFKTWKGRFEEIMKKVKLLLSSQF